MRHAEMLVSSMLLLSGTVPGLGATFQVNDTTDAVDANPGDGVCDAAGSVQCTLRAAIMEANDWPGADRVEVAAGTYALSLTGGGSEWAGAEDLDVYEDLVVEGAPAIVDAMGIDRVFDVQPGASLELRELEIRRGSSDYGGCIRSREELTLFRVDVHGCFATNGGGGVFQSASAAPALVIEDSWIRMNSSNSVGGGVASFDFARIERSTVSGNSALVAGGGLYLGPGSGAENVLINATIVGNLTNGVGGGIDAAAPTRLYNTTVAFNVCDVNNDGDQAGGGVFKANSSPLTVTHSVIASNVCGSFGNETDEDCHSNDGSDFDSDGHNFIGIGTGCPGFTATGDHVGSGPATDSPGFVAYETAGGFGPSYLPGGSSPLVDAGNPAGCVSDPDGSGPGPAQPLTEDQRRTVRPLGVCDIGAVEVQTVFSDGFESGDTSRWSAAVP